MADTDTITGLMSDIPDLIKKIPGLLDKTPAAVKAIGSRLIEAAPYAALVPAMAQGDQGAFALAASMQERKQQREQQSAEHQAWESLARQHGLLGPNEPLPPGDIATAMHILTAPPKKVWVPMGKGGMFNLETGEVKGAPQGTEAPFKSVPAAEAYIATNPTGPYSQAAFDFIRSDTERQMALKKEAAAGGAEARSDTRLDKTYEHRSTELNNMRKPIADQLERMGRLIESVNQQSPTADALVAPELLTAMAGGMGSGLRMNEAEISRIVGGRSKWETLKATLNQWKTDPTKAQSITPAQRQQIAALIEVMHAKNLRKLALIDRAYEELADAGSVDQQRRIINTARRKLDLLSGKAKVLPQLLNKPETTTPSGAPSSAAPDVINLNE